MGHRVFPHACARKCDLRIGIKVTVTYLRLFLLGALHKVAVNS